jgi:hypothetical protein
MVFSTESKKMYTSPHSPAGVHNEYREKLRIHAPGSLSSTERGIGVEKGESYITS